MGLDKLEQGNIGRVLEAVRDNKSKAAHILGIGRARLNANIKKSRIIERN